MSATATAAAPTVAPIARAEGDDRRPGLGRLTAVELRKMVDTRAGFWLQLAVAVLTVALVVVVCAVGHARDQTLRELLSLALQPASVLLPIVGILLVSSEWSQRTAPITFALVPGRSRVVVAKLLASVVVSLVVFVLCLAVAAIGTAIAAPDVAHVWSLPAGLLLQDVLYLVTGMIGGVAFGAALLSSAPAIVLSFVLPIGWSIVSAVAGLDTVARWLDAVRTLGPMSEHVFDATEWAHAATTLGVWMALPLAIGMWRIARGEIR